MAKGRWQKGQSGNPSGRPKLAPGTVLSKVLRTKLGEVDSEKGKTNVEIIAEKMMFLAKQGSIRACAEILDRTEGKPIQQLNLDANLRAATREEHIQSILEALADMKQYDDKLPVQ